MPHDLFIGDVYIPPLLAAAVLAMIAASYGTRVMREQGWMMCFANPPFVFLSITVILTVLFSSTIFPS